MNSRRRNLLIGGLVILGIALVTAILILRPRVRYSERIEFVRVASPISDALQKNASVETIESLINKDPSLLNRPIIGDTPLLLAVMYDRADVVKMLVRRGADPNVRSDPHFEEDTSPLFLAVQLGNTGIAKILIDAGADLSAKGPMDYSMLKMAKYHHDEKMIQLLEDSSKRPATGH